MFYPLTAFEDGDIELARNEMCNTDASLMTDNKHTLAVALSLGNLNKVKCTQCRKRFDTEEEMVQHRQKHATEHKFQCEICHKEFNSHSSMWKHQKAHNGERPFVCQICNKGFTQLANLQRHDLVHNGLKPHKCSVCDKSFTQHANMIKHQMLHTGLKPYKCPACQKAFSQHANMIKHQMLHTGLKPYKCSVCHKSFTQHANMIKHQMLHTGEKPFKCKSCDKAFSQRANLKKHEMVHLGLRPHTCPFCTKSYSQYSNLKKHLLVHQKQSLKQQQGQNGNGALIVIYNCGNCKMQFEDIIEFERHTKQCDMNSPNSFKLDAIKSEIDDGSSGSVIHSQHDMLNHSPNAVASVISSVANASNTITSHIHSSASHLHSGLHGALMNGNGLNHDHHHILAPSQAQDALHLQQQLLIAPSPHSDDHQGLNQFNLNSLHHSHIPHLTHKIFSPLFHIPSAQSHT